MTMLLLLPGAATIPRLTGWIQPLKIQSHRRKRSRREHHGIERDLICPQLHDPALLEL